MPVSPKQRRTTSALQPPSPGPGGHSRWVAPVASGHALALARLAQGLPGPLLVLAPHVRAARQLEQRLGAFLPPELAPGLFPDWESLPYDRFAPHPDLISERLSILYRLPDLARGVLVTAVGTLLQRLAPRRFIDAHVLLLSSGDVLDLGDFRSRLDHAGYRHAGQVMDRGEYAVRGGLLDIYPMGSRLPLRIELFDDRIESIRSFDAETQRSIERLDRVQLLPAREYPFNDDAVRGFRQRYREQFEGDPQRCDVYREVSKGGTPAGLEYYLPLFFEETATLFDYLPANTTIASLDDMDQAVHEFHALTRHRYEQLVGDSTRRLLPPESMLMSAEELQAALSGRPRVTCLTGPAGLAPEAHPLDCTLAPPVPAGAAADAPSRLAAQLRDWPGRVLLTCETAGRHEVLREALGRHGVDLTPVERWQDFLDGDIRRGIAISTLDEDMVLGDSAILILCEARIFGERAAQRRHRRARDPQAIIRSLAQLQLGDAVVHEDHGVGRYRGLATITASGIEAEFLCVEYHGGDKLYVPVLALERLSRYTGVQSGEHTPLHRLGGREWEKARARARRSAHDVAAELLELHALRAARKGRAFSPRDENYAAFRAEFPFEETPDQERAIAEVLDDLESERPMDRLVCGDVGFGKTEVALRACFLAVESGYQVALLAPTTLLTQQHFNNFSDRFAGRAVVVEHLSRFRSAAEVREVLQGLRDGRVDIVVGTHRLLQADMAFKRLGLLIIDEEHRFGVRQKERLKKLRSEVDILTLTATPIPRTLNMAMAGLRDLSIIATPPHNRLAISTFVTEWNDATLREACLRELRRGGQIFFLHNEVRSIERMAEQLAALVPEAELRIAHGQMRERDLEQVMLDFHHQRFSLLLCTTIIESGIDIPNANTIIINRADRFGLAQLHQLRGRVGRSHHRAFAYLLTPPRKSLRGDAAKRLEAIEALDELGAGFLLASHDLEIRGAGELLGEAQSGTIDEVGFAMYSRLLGQAVDSLREGDLPASAKPSAGPPPELELDCAMLFPADYVPDPHARLVLYKRLTGCEDSTATDDLRAEVIDRFGPLPEAASHLFRGTRLAHRAGDLGITHIRLGASGGAVEFSTQPALDVDALIRRVAEHPQDYQLAGSQRLRLRARLEQPGQRFAFLEELLTAITPVA